MHKNSAVGLVSKFCSHAGQSVRIPTNIVTVGSSFLAICNGCDFSCGLPVCIECRADNQRYWNRLHLAHPDLSASQLVSLPFDDSI